ncbi:MAG: NDP-hexose 2,3-dehydratase family protein [Nitrospirota bacterium]|nr:NDP-hexose 2,3-dehydratase family protein [Nitrospirota bacterium]
MSKKEFIPVTSEIRELIASRLQQEPELSMVAALGFGQNTIVDVVVSRLTRDSLHDDDHVDRWICEQRLQARLRTDVVPLDQLDQWARDPSSGNIAHRSGRFFSITGLAVRHRTEYGELEWDQPIIDQPEIGILGILAKRINGVLHFCLQAKEEPGNLHFVQLSPTVQATYSNYTRVHGGSLPPFLAQFMEPERSRRLYAKLQTEDGGRFLFKSNRNMIVLAQDQETNDLPDGFIWLTLRQIARLVQKDNLVNACARSVLSSLFGSLRTRAHLRVINAGSDNTLLSEPGRCSCDPQSSVRTGEREKGERDLAGLDQIIQWLDDMKARNHIFQKRIGLDRLSDWEMDRSGSYSHKQGKFFKIIGIKVTSQSREVATWSQPILDNVGTGIIGLLLRQDGERTSLLMQAKAEVGNRNIVQIGPTVQFTQENYSDDGRLRKPFLFEEFMRPVRFPVLQESRQSEEGARFFREEHLHRILLLPEGAELDVPPEFRWMSLEEVRWFLLFGEQVNSCARSILGTLL